MLLNLHHKKLQIYLNGYLIKKNKMNQKDNELNKKKYKLKEKLVNKPKSKKDQKSRNLKTLLNTRKGGLTEMQDSEKIYRIELTNEEYKFLQNLKTEFCNKLSKMNDEERAGESNSITKRIETKN